MKTGRPPPYTRFDHTGGAMGKGGGRSWWGRIRSGTGNLLTHTVFSAAGTAGAILGVQAVLPAPSPPQDFKNANMMAPKFQDTRALINGNFDAGSSWMIILAVVASAMTLGLICWCNKCRKWVPSVGAKREEIRQEQMQISAMNRQEVQFQVRLQERLMTNPWNHIESGRYLPRVTNDERNWEKKGGEKKGEEDLDSLKISVARDNARKEEEEWMKERRKEWEEKEKKEEWRGGWGEEEEG